MAFHDIRFPPSLSFGALGGPERRTDIVTLSNGFEERNTAWAQSRRRYDAGLGLRSMQDLEQVIAFFEARQGQLHSFRWKDWADFKSSAADRDVQFDDQLVGIGDGVSRVFQLVKTYRSGGHSVTRPITKPVAATVQVAVQGDPLVAGQNYDVDGNTGMIEFDIPPAEGLDITAGFEFDVPVRFDTPQIRISLASFNAGEVPDVPVIEVRQ